jgi:glycosyltransferase involved in cell wall biosynthesis
MHVLTYTSLYPTNQKPVHGIFVRELVRSLSRMLQVQVLAPENGLRKLLERPRQGPLPAVPDDNALRCRFWTVPKFLKSLDGRLMATFSRRAFARATVTRPDLVHAHYAYPDGAAAALLARRAGLPLVITCHGSDINVLAQDRVRKPLIRRTLSQASAVVAVSRALAGRIADLGVDPASIHHIPNGVDLSRFPMGDKSQARRLLGLHGESRLLVAAGRLEPVKGYDRLLKALALLDAVRLVIVGDGSLAGQLCRLAQDLGISDRVSFAGMVPHTGLAPYFQAADALVISSHSEGWPTVIHEAMSSGTPVVAPAVGGIPEALADPSLGLIVSSGEPDVLAAGISRALGIRWDPAVLRRAAAEHDWDVVARRHVELYEQVLRQTL